MTALAAARVSFAEASELLAELAGLDIEPKSVERRTEALGRDLARDERRVVRPEPSAAYTLYLGLDGTGVPVRPSETRGRPGRQPDGSARTREAKLATVWSAETQNLHGDPVRDPHSVSVNAAIETAAILETDTRLPPFALRILRELRRRRFHRAPRRVVLGDGARWIWNFADEHLPRAIQIVDFFHASEHLFQVAADLYGPSTDLARHWANLRLHELEHGRFDQLLAALRRHAHDSPLARTNLAYFARNRPRMRYPLFRAQRLCVTTGVVEGACKNVVAARLKRGGMHWTVRGANAILALRCSIISNRFDDFWERRAAS